MTKTHLNSTTTHYTHNTDTEIKRKKMCTFSFNMEGTVIRRVIPSDNSCLFNAVGYVMDHDKNKAPELRQWVHNPLATDERGPPLCEFYNRTEDISQYSSFICEDTVTAATVASDPTQYSEAFLGKPNEEYCTWILDPEKWGGAIELAILADYYGREIAAYDIQTLRCDLYGQGKNYHERVMLIYDGLHYDALAMSPSDGAPEEFDQTIFMKDGTAGMVERLALNLVREQQSEKKLHRHCQLYFAMWGLPNWSHWPKGSCGACTSNRTCELSRIQMMIEIESDREQK
ncbi:unnamed protein product [Camellia sinensis]